EDVDEIAVTRGPGLIGALLVGVSTAKALAAAHRKPMAGVDHLHGHVAANFLEPDPLDPPFLCLIASGGHTLLAAVRHRAGLELLGQTLDHTARGDPAQARPLPAAGPDRPGFELLGQTLDGAAGEARDKAARLLGLGYPGGPAIQRLAERGGPEAYEFPVGL